MLAPSSRPVRSVRYRIDGYVLELTADDGAVVRYFIARFDFDDDNADGPGLLYLGGEMLWDRDKEDKPTKKKLTEAAYARRGEDGGGPRPGKSRLAPNRGCLLEISASYLGKPSPRTIRSFRLWST